MKAGGWEQSTNGCLCEGQSSLVVHVEDLLDCVDVSSRPQVQTQVVLACRAHDLLKCTDKTISGPARLSHVCLLRFDLYWFKQAEESRVF